MIAELGIVFLGVDWADIIHTVASKEALRKQISGHALCMLSNQLKIYVFLSVSVVILLSPHLRRTSRTLDVDSDHVLSFSTCL